jgi:hypothetical protein
VQSRPAGRAPPARFLREELLEVTHHADRARAIVEDDHRACSETAAGLLDRLKIHRHVEVIGDEKIG